MEDKVIVSTSLLSNKVKELVKGNFVKFDRFKEGYFYYILRDGDFEHYTDYQFPVPINDIGAGTLYAEEKAITFMRWIRLSIENNTFFKV